MSEIAILPVVPGSLSKADKAALRKAGVVVLEHADPSSLRLIRPTAELDSSDMLACAMKALQSSKGSSGGDAQRIAFTNELAIAVLAAHTKGMK